MSERQPGEPAMDWQREEGGAPDEPAPRETLRGVGGRWEATIVESSGGDFEVTMFHADTPTQQLTLGVQGRKMAAFSRHQSLMAAKAAAEIFTDEHWGEDEPDLNGQSLQIAEIDPETAQAMLRSSGRPEHPDI